MTRDDMLRELELLPMWTLRAPDNLTQLSVIGTKDIVQVEIARNDPLSDIVASIKQAERSVTQSNTLMQFDITLSQDKNWAFVSKLFVNDHLPSETSMPADRMDIGLQATLLNNILQALHIEKSSKMNTQNLGDIDAKIIVAFGEVVAQSLLKSQEKLENLQGKLHAIVNSQLIATHELSQLAFQQHKSQLWQDLCLARSYLQNLQS